MEILIKSINGWIPPSPVQCNPTRITQVDSEVNSVGDLNIKKLLSTKMKFAVEWQHITKSQAQRIMSEMQNFNALVVYEDIVTGATKSGRFYPGDFQPVPSVAYQNGEMIYKSFPLNIIEK